MAQIGTHVLNHLVRRTIEYNTQAERSLKTRAEPSDDVQIDIPVWGIGVIVATIAVFSLFLLSVRLPRAALPQS
jgi:hypothetical protein